MAVSCVGSPVLFRDAQAVILLSTARKIVKRFIGKPTNHPAPSSKLAKAPTVSPDPLGLRLVLGAVPRQETIHRVIDISHSKL